MKPLGSILAEASTCLKLLTKVECDNGWPAWKSNYGLEVFPLLASHARIAATGHKSSSILAMKMSVPRSAFEHLVNMNLQHPWI